jgi:hypothetical protein
MLYNQKWDKQDVWSVASLVAWLKTKDPTEVYPYIDGERCLLAQYFNDMGMQVYYVFAGDVVFKSVPLGFVLLPWEFQRIAYPYGREGTFGAALGRANGYLSA